MNTELRTFQLMVEAQSYYLNKDVHKGQDNNIFTKPAKLQD